MNMNFLYLIMMLSFFFMFLNHPLSFGLILLIQTILLALTSGMMNFNFWFSYILFLIMIGGMLILFIYMTSIASNEKFIFSFKLFMVFMFLMMIMMLINLIDYYFFNFNLNTYEIQNQNFINYNKFSLNKYINKPSNLIFFSMIIYLLITLILVVKITNIKFGPLRQKY
nr:NADH dehydrogenase subunit 6 [Teledapalpus zolotichini]